MMSSLQAKVLKALPRQQAPSAGLRAEKQAAKHHHCVRPLSSENETCTRPHVDYIAHTLLERERRHLADTQAKFAALLVSTEQDRVTTQQQLCQSISRKGAELIIEFARQLTQSTLQDSAELRIKLANTLQENLKPDERGTLLLSSKESEAVYKTLVHLLEKKPIALQTAQDLVPGEYILRTNKRQLDARLDTKLEYLRKYLETAPIDSG